MAEKLAIGGIVSILKQKNHPSFEYYAQRFIDHFSKQDPRAAEDLRQQIIMQKSFVVGGTAPDFAQDSPEGESINLSDLRGKVVLVDFWASWCGPCRRENPNVKRVYEEYKNKGFEILAVSLDRTKDRWLQAIEADGLPWLHVRDLKGWGNEVAQMYSVKSIPHTILLDAEGKIIARGLRGPQLEAKIAELLD
jgi:thiol-disulfide isomerase/thioredoxin